jgi:hypothetical protein
VSRSSRSGAQTAIVVDPHADDRRVVADDTEAEPALREEAGAEPFRVRDADRPFACAVDDVEEAPVYEDAGESPAAREVAGALLSDGATPVWLAAELLGRGYAPGGAEDAGLAELVDRLLDN